MASNFFKRYQFGPEFPKTGEPCVQIIDGRSVDGIKLASEATDYIKHVQPETGKTIILVLAMTAGEYYGPNRNADAFSERPVPGRVEPGQTLPEHVKSFETLAKCYLHHANKEVEKSVGDVMRAFYNWDMHRVELLLRLDNDKAASIVESIDAGKYPSVSMGCKISYDVCDICGNKARTRAEYCDDMKYQAGELLPDGRRIFVWNPSPRLFDISFVMRPADKIAFMMKKVAHEGPVTTSAELGEASEALKQKMAAARKLADITKIIRGDAVDTTMPEDEAKKYQGYVQHSMPTVLAGREELPEGLLRALSLHPLDNTLSTLSDLGVDPTAGETVSIIMRKMHGEMPPGLKQAVDMTSAGLMEVLASDSRIMASLLDEPVIHLDSSQVDGKIASLIGPFIEKRSNLKRYLYMNATSEWARPNEPGRWDLIHTTDPVSGQQYETTRGAADMANDANVKRQFAIGAGLGTLGAGSYKLLSTMGHPVGALAAAGGAALAARPIMDFVHVPEYSPQEPEGSHLTVPINAQMQKMSGAQHMLPGAMATLAMINLLGHEHNIATNYGDLPVPEGSSANKLKNIKSLAANNPALAFVTGLLLMSMAKTNMKVASVVDNFVTNEVSQDGNTPKINVMKFAEFIGTGLLDLASLLNSDSSDYN